MAKKVSKKKSAKKSKAAEQARPAQAPGKGKAAKKAKAAAKRPRKKSRLSKPELKEFRQMLLEKRRDLLGDMSGIEAEALRSRQGGSGDLSNMPTHLADLGTDNYEKEFTLGLLESERILLREIDEALERIEGGSYGICLGTGEAIRKARLRARPWAKYCIKYARLLEKGLVRPPMESEQEPEPEPEAEADDEGEQGR